MSPIWFVAAGAIGFVLCGSWTSQAFDGPSPPRDTREPARVDAILEELDGARFPAVSTASTPEAAARLQARTIATAERVVELTRKLERASPRHPRLAEWLDKRWALLSNTLKRPQDVLREAMPRANDASDPAHREARLARAEAALHDTTIAYARRAAWITAAQESGADPVRVGMAWVELASCHATGVEDQRLALTAARRCETSDPHVEVPRKALETRLAWTGRALELEFMAPGDPRSFRANSLGSRHTLLLIWSGSSTATLDAIRGALCLRRELGAERLALLGMHEWRIEGGRPALEQRLRELAFEVPHHYEEPADPWSGRVRELGVRRVPTFFLLDAEGRVLLTSQSLATIATRL